MRGIAVLLVAACGNTSTTATTQATGGQPTTTTPPPPTPACDPDVPAAACSVQAGLRVCKDGDPARVGEWRYAIAAPAYAPVEDITAAELEALWKGARPGVQLAASAETRALLATQWGAGK